MDITKEQIKAYLDYNKNRWSPSTLKSESSRLKGLVDLYNKYPETPSNFYDTLIAIKKPYTVKTSFMRINGLLSFLNIKSPYSTFLTDFSNLFKNVYKTEVLEVSFEEAEKRILTIKNKKVRNHCLGLLYTGLRANESVKVVGGTVVGKGSKERTVFGKIDLLSNDIPYITLYKSLKKVGLKPHSLRKLFATRLSEKGLKEADLCSIMGWSTFTTASRYLQPKAKKELGNIINEL